jgi:hypothetical protein
VKDDTELEDEESSHLGRVRFGHDAGSFLLSLGPTGGELIVNVITSMAEVVVAASVGSGGTVSSTRASTSSVHLIRGIGMVVDFRRFPISKRLRLDTQVVRGLEVIMPMAVSELGVAHGHELDKEQDENGHQNNAFDPIVLGDRASQARIGKGIIGRCQ